MSSAVSRATARGRKGVGGDHVMGSNVLGWGCWGKNRKISTLGTVRRQEERPRWGLHRARETLKKMRNAHTGARQLLEERAMVYRGFAEEER